MVPSDAATVTAGMQSVEWQLDADTRLAKSSEAQWLHHSITSQRRHDAPHPDGRSGSRSES
jgi:hypothetical protein